MSRLKPLKVDTFHDAGLKQSVEILFDREDHVFLATFQHQTLKAPSVAELRKLLSVAMKAARHIEWRRWIGLNASTSVGTFDAPLALPLKAYAEVGDRLWGREAWRVNARFDKLPPRNVPLGVPVEYIADGTSEQYGRYRHARFMMRWMSRLLHEVKAVRVERLQDITDDDAIAEGLLEREGDERNHRLWSWPGGESLFESPRACYLAGWDTINGAGSAAENPWVHVVSFRPVPR